MLPTYQCVPQRCVAMALALLLLAATWASAADEAAAPGLEKTITLDLGKGVTMDLVLIPAGSFMMGDNKGSMDQRPAHKVTFTKPFYMGKYLVTVAQWEALMGPRRARFGGGGSTPPGKTQTPADGGQAPAGGTQPATGSIGGFTPRTPPGGAQTPAGDQATPAGNQPPAGRPQPLLGGPASFNGPTNPVGFTSWQSADAFVKALNEKLGSTGGKVSLPTEAQWEYACRAGTTTKYYFGNDATDFARYGWFRNNSNRTTHPVGQKEPNAWGLYDMHGEVWQWCNDWYDKDYYSKSPEVDPPGPAEGVVKVLRGAGWNDDPMYGTSTFRNRNTTGGGSNDQGFRVVFVK